MKISRFFIFLGFFTIFLSCTLEIASDDAHLIAFSILFGSAAIVNKKSS